MTAEEFDAYTRGKTLTFGFADDTPYGAESYLGGRRVIWTWLDGSCEWGKWYPQDEAICFVYEFDDEPQCWLFWDRPEGLEAVYLNEPDTTVLYEAQETGGISCPGPGV